MFVLLLLYMNGHAPAWYFLLYHRRKVKTKRLYMYPVEIQSELWGRNYNNNTPYVVINHRKRTATHGGGEI